MFACRIWGFPFGVSTLVVILRCRVSFRVRGRASEVPEVGSTLCPGRKAGAVVVCGLMADRNGLTNVPVHWASRRIVGRFRPLATGR